MDPDTKKVIAGVLGIVVFGATCVKAKRSKIVFPGELNPNLSPQEAQVHNKVATYLFATRAFMVSSTLVASASLSIACGVSYCMGVNSLKEFAIKTQSNYKAAFPSLVISSPIDDEGFDEVAQEWQDALDENESVSDTVLYYQQAIRKRVFGL